MKQLTIDWSALKLAFDVVADEFGTDCSHYLDVESGAVVCVDEEIGGTVELIVDELQESLGDVADWTDDLIRETDTFQKLSKEEQLSVLAAVKIGCGESKKFARVPGFDSHQSYQWMADFIEIVDNGALRRRLSEAISQRKPFRRFRDVLAGDRRLEQRWREVEAARQRETIIKWLRSISVEPENPDRSIYNPPPLPDLRSIMFAEVQRFVRLAREIEGIRRIALVGSLAADKEFPKDIDLLVTVSKDCDLAPLAKLARQLCGHMNSHRAGADLFLASEDGDYLGRICQWRDCGPGIRASCDALHCGLRPFLHDDFGSVRLKKDLITHPPVLLWPDPAANHDVVADVHEHLIKHLAE